MFLRKNIIFLSMNQIFLCNIVVLFLIICIYYLLIFSGMRTHIRMHFDKKSGDFNEEQYISCITEDDGLESSHHQQQPSPSAPQQQPLTASSVTVMQSQSSTNETNSSPIQLHHCDKCNYSSGYKGNVVSCDWLILCQRFSKRNVFFSWYFKVRHIKLVHSMANYQRSTSPALGEGGESLLVASESPKPLSNSFR